jgi:pimeloyl-ACP methyl ester carboxylesterase
MQTHPAPNIGSFLRRKKPTPRKRYAALAALALAGCGGAPDLTSEDVSQRAAISVNAQTLQDYVGLFRLPSGALLPVIRDGDRLLAGTPPAELLAQSTRKFTSNGFFGDVEFERSVHGHVERLNWRLAKRSHWCPRVNPATAIDPTQMVDADGVRLRILKIGQGSPTIVLEDGFGNGIEAQSSLQAALAKETCVVTYNHAGTGGSDPGPAPRNARQTARELRAALAAAGISPPFVLVGGSIGGDYCRVFANEYPVDTAGLVLLDPTPDWDALFAWAAVHAPGRAESYRRITEESAKAMQILMRDQEPGRRAEWDQLETTRRQAGEAFPLPKIPIIQITGAAGREFSPIVDDKVRFFDAWLQEHIPHAEHVLATHSAHAVSITDQELVVEQVNRLLAQLRN